MKLPALLFAAAWAGLTFSVAQVPAPDAPAEPPPAGGAEDAAEAVIPRAFDAARYKDTWAKNPFLLKTVAIAGPKVNFAQDWALSGMYKSVSGEIQVYIQNKQTSEVKRVTSKGDPTGEFRLIQANFNRNRSEASAEIAKGSEVAELKYDENLTARPLTINNTLRAPAAPPGAGAAVPAAARPGQPVNATPPAGARNAAAALPGANPPLPQPGVPAPALPAASGQAPTPPPTISRRRQLIPAPVTPPQQ